MSGVLPASEGTGELFAADPPRTIKLPSDRLSRAAWWGVDPSTVRVSIATVFPSADGGLHRTALTRSFSRLEGAQRLSAIYEETHDLAAALATDEALSDPPGFVVVEQPFAYGHSVPPALFYACGVVQAAIYDALLAELGGPVVIETLGPGEWKSRALGRGNAGKPEVMRWAQANGYEGQLQDEADAWAIAEAARRTVAFA